MHTLHECNFLRHQCVKSDRIKARSPPSLMQAKPMSPVLTHEASRGALEPVPTACESWRRASVPRPQCGWVESSHGGSVHTTGFGESCKSEPFFLPAPPVGKLSRHATGQGVFSPPTVKVPFIFLISSRNDVLLFVFPWLFQMPVFLWISKIIRIMREGEGKML